MRLRFLLSALILSATLAVSEIYIVANSLFWRFRWIDTPMHVLGGLAISSFVVGLVGNHQRLYIVAAALLFITWEVFEFFGGIPQQPGNYLFDTIHDLANDAVGAWFVYMLAKETIWHSK